MEHSALHAFELIGQIIAFGGIFLVVGLLWPAMRKLSLDENELTQALRASAEKWIFRGALMAAMATFLNLFVEVSEVQGKTVFGGVDLHLFNLFAAKTHVGQLGLMRVFVLLLTAAATRLGGNLKWVLTALGTLGAIFLTCLVSHSAAKPEGQLLNVGALMAHIVTAALWLGILIQLLAARSWIQGDAGQTDIRLVAEIVRRFSPVALAVTTLLAISGLYMVFSLGGGFTGLLASAYGLTLFVKLTLLAPALMAGWINYRVVRPHLIAFSRMESAARTNHNVKNFAMAVAGGHDLSKEQSHISAHIKQESRSVEHMQLLRHFGRMLELEVTAGILVVIAAGILASVSPPGESGNYRLTNTQAFALIHPRFPDAKIINPESFYGAAERTQDDFTYSEFTHHWSGVMVCLLGFGWMLQSVRGRTARWAGIGWPFLLLPFMAFVAIASDPEVWLMRRVPLQQVLSDPQLLEHQLGAVMILALAWLGWRDRKKPQAMRPLGYALPAIFILGGVLLLGHAHSTLNITEEVTNLINYQHAIFGAFILFAGMVRWLSLRDLFPRRVADVLWPSLICGLGLFMAFFYRELV